MINSEKNLFLEETEIKPNRYAVIVVSISLVSILFCLILNELGIFRVGTWEMRIGAVIPFLTSFATLMRLLGEPASLERPDTKYLVMGNSIIYAFTVTTLMTFHTTLMLLFPIFIGMLYRSRKIGVLAVAGSFFCTFVSPILGYILGTWDIPLFEELILIGTNGTTEIIGAHAGISLLSVGKILLYIVLPRSLIVGSVSLLLFYVISLGEKNVADQVALNRLSHRDFLTGFYNQNYFKEILGRKDLKGPAAVIFFDVNGLKKANDEYGHEYGDILLMRSAESINRVWNEETSNGFRVGGDEFLVIMEGADEEQVRRKLSYWEAALAVINIENYKLHGDSSARCSVAAGYVLGDLSELEILVKTADEEMYKNKLKMKERKNENIRG